jgi:hypothetical protein
MDVAPPGGDFILHLGGPVEYRHAASLLIMKGGGTAASAIFASHRLNSTGAMRAGQRMPGFMRSRRHLCLRPYGGQGGGGKR